MKANFICKLELPGREIREGAKSCMGKPLCRRQLAPHALRECVLDEYPMWSTMQLPLLLLLIGM